MASVNLSSVWGGGAQLFDNQGNVLAGGLVYVYTAGSGTLQTTYTDATGLVANANPIVLDSAGRFPAEMWIPSGISIKLILTDYTGALVGPTLDNIAGISPAGGSTSFWVAATGTPAYINATTFSIPGNQTAVFPGGIRVKATVTAGPYYGTVLTSSYSSGSNTTTVGVEADSTSLDSGLSNLFVSAIPATGSPVSFYNTKLEGTTTAELLNVSGGVAVATLTSAGTLAGTAVVLPSTGGSPNPNALDSYLDSSIPLQLNFGGAHSGMSSSFSLANATNIGAMQFCAVYIDLVSKGSSSGAATITGFPTSISAQTFLGYVNPTAANAGFTPIMGFLAGGTLTLYSNATPAVELTDAFFSNTSQIYFNLAYPLR